MNEIGAGELETVLFTRFKHNIGHPHYQPHHVVALTFGNLTNGPIMIEMPGQVGTGGVQ